MATPLPEMNHSVHGTLLTRTGARRTYLRGEVDGAPGARRTARAQRAQQRQR